MAASHIAVRARSYGSFPVSADAHDEIWLKHSHERISQRRALDASHRRSQLFPSFLSAFPVLRDASQHLRALVMGACSLVHFEKGGVISSDASPALVLIIAGEASLGSGAIVSQGVGVGEEILWGEPASTLEAASHTCTAVVLEFAMLKQSLSESRQYSAFEKRLLLHRAWHRGLAEDSNMGAQEVQEFVSSLVDAASANDAATTRKVAETRQDLLALAEGKALHSAAMNGAHSCIDIVLGLESSPDARNGSGQTPLHAAALVGDAIAGQKLLEAKANPNNSDMSLRTPLHIAAQEGCLDVARALLKAGATVDVQDSRLSTPAHLACAAGHPHVVKALLVAGCNMRKKDHHGRTVWNVARYWKDNLEGGEVAGDRSAVYDMVNLVFRREKLLTDWAHPCGGRDRTYLEMPEPEPEPEPELESKPVRPSFNLV
jgi:uncharacterized protein YfiM (DUF2279 family)